MHFGRVRIYFHQISVFGLAVRKQESSVCDLRALRNTPKRETELRPSSFI